MKMKLSGFLAFALLSISILSFGLTGAVNAQSVLPVSVETDSSTLHYWKFYCNFWFNSKFSLNMNNL